MRKYIVEFTNLTTIEIEANNQHEASENALIKESHTRDRLKSVWMMNDNGNIIEEYTIKNGYVQ